MEHRLHGTLSKQIRNGKLDVVAKNWKYLYLYLLIYLYLYFNFWCGPDYCSFFLGLPDLSVIGLGVEIVYLSHL